jgi:hypothetical protein
VAGALYSSSFINYKLDSTLLHIGDKSVDNVVNIFPVCLRKNIRMALLQSIIGFALATFAIALPANPAGVQGISFLNGDVGQPLLTMDYATYKGSYNNYSDVNIPAITEK